MIPKKNCLTLCSLETVLHVHLYLPLFTVFCFYRRFLLSKYMSHGRHPCVPHSKSGSFSEVWLWSNIVLGESEISNSVLVEVESYRITFKCVYVFQAWQLVSSHLLLFLLRNRPLSSAAQGRARLKEKACDSFLSLECFSALTLFSALLYRKAGLPASPCAPLLPQTNSHSSPHSNTVSKAVQQTVLDPY